MYDVSINVDIQINGNNLVITGVSPTQDPEFVTITFRHKDAGAFGGSNFCFSDTSDPGKYITKYFMY